jgi:hypothetical protein
MCFSPEADFVAGAAVAAVGVETLRRVRFRRELVVGALPLLFGVHQLVEGFVWLGLRGQVSSGIGDAAKQIYIVYAHAVLPAIVPLGFALLEPDRARSRLMWPLVCVGLILGAYLLWQVTAYPVGAQEQARCIDYTTHTPNDILIGVLGVIAVALVRADELTSLWCVYVAFVSVLILEHFRRQRSADARRDPVPSQALRPDVGA